MDPDFSLLLLFLGLVVGVWLLIYTGKKVRRCGKVLYAIFNIGFALLAVTPAILIKLGMVSQTATTVSLAIVYFLVFVIGAMRVDSRKIRDDHK
jgi:hypothetical protein